MNKTKTELIILGAPMSSDASLASAMTEEEFLDKNKKPMGYCENPLICAGTVIGGLIASIVVFYLLFKWQKRHQGDGYGDDDDEDGNSTRRKYRFDQTVTMFDQFGDGAAGEDGNEHLEKELSEMQVDPNARRLTAASSSTSPASTSLNNHQQHDPHADEFTSYFEQQGFGSDGSGLRRKMPKQQADQQQWGVSQLQQDMEFV